MRVACKDELPYAQFCESIGRRLAMQIDHGYDAESFMETRQEFIRGAHFVAADAAPR